MKKKELKAELAYVKGQLREIVLHPNSLNSFMIRNSIMFEEQIEKGMWFGDAMQKPKELRIVDTSFAKGTDLYEDFKKRYSKM